MFRTILWHVDPAHVTPHLTMATAIVLSLSPFLLGRIMPTRNRKFVHRAYRQWNILRPVRFMEKGVYHTLGLPLAGARVSLKPDRDLLRRTALYADSSWSPAARG